MAEILLGENDSVERALKLFRRKLQKEGLFKEIRRRRHYVKPSAARRSRRPRLRGTQAPAGPGQRLAGAAAGGRSHGLPFIRAALAPQIRAGQASAGLAKQLKRKKSGSGSGTAAERRRTCRASRTPRPRGAARQRLTAAPGAIR
jgi:small subunit ribosomal protein S21